LKLRNDFTGAIRGAILANHQFVIEIGFLLQNTFDGPPDVVPMIISNHADADFGPIAERCLVGSHFEPVRRIFSRKAAKNAKAEWA
jgi:hypothetical protein